MTRFDALASALDSTFLVSITLALLHFVWIGLLIASLASIASRLLRRASPQARYLVHAAALAAMALSLPATLAMLWRDAPVARPALAAEPIAAAVDSHRADASSTESPAAIAIDHQESVDNHRARDLTSEAPVAMDAAAAAPRGVAQASRALLERFAPYVATAYLLGVVAMLARLALGLWGARRLRRLAVPVAEAAVLEMLARQARRMGLACAPVIAWCERIAVPVVVGVVKPMILLPASLATGLTADQLESLLAHELAHIRRFDLVVNLLQRFVEAVLFFHPAVWYVSRRVSAEREHACDDRVLSAGWPRIEYADALVRMAELTAAARGPTLVAHLGLLAASGAAPLEFKRRVLRLLGQEPLPVLQLGRAGVVAVVLASSLLVIAPLAISMRTIAAAGDDPASTSNAPAPPAAPTSGQSWAQFGGSSLRNHVSPAVNLPVAFDVATGQHVKWTARLGSATYGSPVIADGKVLIGTNNAQARIARYPQKVDLACLQCFDLQTGRFLWQYSSEKLPSGRVNDWPAIGLCSTACVLGDRVWLVTNRCEVVCLDLNGFLDGENDGPVRDEPQAADEADVVWRLDMFELLGIRPMHQSASSVTLAGDLVLLNTSNGTDESHANIPAPTAPSFVAVDRHTGRVVWSDASPGANILSTCPSSSPAVAEIGGVWQAIFAGGDGWLYGFDLADMRQGKTTLLWSFDCNPKESVYLLGGRGTRQSLVASPVVYEQRVYIAVGSSPEQGEGIGRLWCIDPTKRGDISAELAVEANNRQKTVPKRRNRALNPPTEIAISNPNSGVVWHYSEFDLNLDGKIAFEETMHRTVGSVAVAEGLLVVTDFSGLLHCVDARTGILQWTHDQMAATWCTPLIAQGRVYVADEDGDITVFRLARKKEVLAEINVEQSIYGSFAAVDGTLMVASKSKLIAAGDAAAPRKGDQGTSPQPSAGPPAANAPAGETGQVLTIEQWPVAEVEVVAYRRSGARVAAVKTDAQGRFAILPDGWRDEAGDENDLVLVAADGPRLGWFDMRHRVFEASATASKSLPAAAAAASPEPIKSARPSVKIVMLHCDEIVRGQLTDGAGRPLAGVRVQAVRLNHSANSHASLFGFGVGDELPLPRATSNADGQFELRVPKGSLAEARTLHRDWMTQSFSASELSEARSIALKPAGRVSGRVTVADTGKPVAGVGVSARGISSDGRTGGYGYATTDADGRYEIGGLNPEHYNVQVGKWRDNRQLVSPVHEAVQLLAAQATIADRQLIVGRRLHGRVVDAVTGQTVAGGHVIARVSLRPNDDSVSVGRMAKANQRGEFELFLPPGICLVYVDQPGREHHADSRRSLEFAVEGAGTLQTTQIELKIGPPLKPGSGPFASSAVVATAVANPPKPVRHKLAVTLRTTAPLLIGEHIVRLVFSDRNFVSEKSLRVGSQFEQEFMPEAAGRKASLLIDVPGFAPTRSAEVVVGANMPPLTIDLATATVVPVRGRVVDGAGQPLAGVRVRVRRVFYGSDTEFPWGPETATAADGRFELKHLRAGEQIIVRAERDQVGQAETKLIEIAGAGWQAQVGVLEGQAKPKAIEIAQVNPLELPPLVIAPPSAEVSGRVTDQDALPVAGAVVEFNGQPRRETKTDADGQFRLTSLPAGKLGLALRAPDGSRASHFVTAGATDVRLFLPLETLYNRAEYWLPVRLRAPLPPGAKASYYLIDQTAHKWLQSGQFNADGRLDLDLHSALRRHADHKLALVVLAEAHALAGPIELVTQPKPQPLMVALQPARSVALRGRVVDSTGQPIAGATVGLSQSLTDKVLAEPWKYISNRPEQLPVTAADGTFELPGQLAGMRVAVYVNLASHAGAWSERVAIGGTADVVLPDVRLAKATRRLAGRVLGSDNRPIAGARVWVHDFSRPATTTEAAGRFELSSVPDGPLLLVADALGYRDRAQPITVEQAAGEIVVHLEPDGNQFAPPARVPGK